MSINIPSSPAAIETDAVIVGAGPVGLFQVFELGLLEIKAHVIDTLSAVGGQCVELYPDKPIYDIPAVPMCTGQDLADRLLEQIKPFAPTFHLGQEVVALYRREDGRFDMVTSLGTCFITKTVFIAAGVGAFQPRALKVEGIEQFIDQQLFYRVQDPSHFADRHIVIVGGGDSALDWALALVGKAASVVLLHRREQFRAAPASVAKMHALCEAFEMQSMVGQITGFEMQDAQLREVKVTGNDGITRRVPLDDLLVFFGLSPKLGPIAHWGLDLERKQIKVDTEKFETSIPGIFAVGDINTYPGKKKLILSGFHEAALAAFGAAHYIFPEKRVHLQYTTTSTKLHKVLGVETPVFD
ncbi:MAG: NAD(P)/FAD-dependent oxidoreductase [Ottowia sp.]|nr:NAD(P)/FAD-dependent oxidoreductase [Ottowia sp.]